VDTISECLPIVSSIRDLLPPGVIARQRLAVLLQNESRSQHILADNHSGQGLVWHAR
jgi:hypothetical protein